MEEQRRHEITHDHLRLRTGLTGGGAAVALAGSLLPWTRGLTDLSGPVTEGRLQGDGRYTALLALGVAAAAAWYWLRPLRVAAIAGAAGAAGLLVASISEWNIVSDDVSSVNLSNGIYATARVAPGLWILLAGAAVATVGALWTLRVER